jgi:hypothetical protein
VKQTLLRSFACACLLALMAPAFGQTKLPRVDFTDTRLENGLRVIIAPDHLRRCFPLM